MQRHRLCGVHTEKATLPGRLSFPLIIFFACTVTSTANLRSKILWRHVLGPRMLWIYYRGLVYNSGLTRANRVPLEVRVSTYVPECLSLPLRHPPRRATDETTNRPKWHRPPRVRPIMSLRFLPTRLSFSFHPSFLRAQVFFFLDYFYRIMLTRGAMAKHEFSKREPRSRKWIFCRAGCKRDSGFFFCKRRKSWQKSLYVAVPFVFSSGS